MVIDYEEDTHTLLIDGVAIRVGGEPTPEAEKHLRAAIFKIEQDILKAQQAIIDAEFDGVMAREASEAAFQSAREKLVSRVMDAYWLDRRHRRLTKILSELHWKCPPGSVIPRPVD